MLKDVLNAGDTIILHKITRKETCHKCAGIHSRDCTATKKKCVNCMFKIRYNLKINDEHGALSPECPTFTRTLQEEKRRTGRTLNSNYREKRS